MLGWARAQLCRSDVDEAACVAVAVGVAAAGRVVAVAAVAVLRR